MRDRRPSSRRVLRHKAHDALADMNSRTLHLTSSHDVGDGTNPAEEGMAILLYDFNIFLTMKTCTFPATRILVRSAFLISLYNVR